MKIELSVTVVVSQEQPHSSVGSVHVYVTALNVCRALPLQEEEGQQQDAACMQDSPSNPCGSTAHWHSTREQAAGSRKMLETRGHLLSHLSAPEQGVLLPALCVLTAPVCVQLRASQKRIGEE